MRVKYIYSKKSMNNQRREIKEELVGLKNNDGEYLHGDMIFPEKSKEKNPLNL